MNGGIPGSSSTTATSVSLGGYKNNEHYRQRGNNYHATNGNGPVHIESSNMLISTMATPPSGNGRRPAVGRGYNKSSWLNNLLYLPAVL